MSVRKEVNLSGLIDPMKMGRFIGKNGSTIKQIEKERSVLIQMNCNSFCHTLTATGLETNVDLAIVDVYDAILGILTESPTHVFRVPSESLGYLIGRNGRKINQVKQYSNAGASFGPPTNGMCEMKLEGSFRSIVTATNMVHESLCSLKTSEAPSTSGKF